MTWLGNNLNIFFKNSPCYFKGLYSLIYQRRKIDYFFKIMNSNSIPKCKSISISTLASGNRLFFMVVLLEGHVWAIEHVGSDPLSRKYDHQLDDPDGQCTAYKKKCTSTAYIDSLTARANRLFLYTIVSLPMHFIVQKKIGNHLPSSIEWPKGKVINLSQNFSKSYCTAVRCNKTKGTV